MKVVTEPSYGITCGPSAVGGGGAYAVLRDEQRARARIWARHVSLANPHPCAEQVAAGESRAASSAEACGNATDPYHLARLRDETPNRAVGERHPAAPGEQTRQPAATSRVPASPIVVASGANAALRAVESTRMRRLTVSPSAASCDAISTRRDRRCRSRRDDTDRASRCVARVRRTVGPSPRSSEPAA